MKIYKAAIIGLGASGGVNKLIYNNSDDEVIALKIQILKVETIFLVSAN